MMIFFFRKRGQAGVVKGKFNLIFKDFHGTLPCCRTFQAEVRCLKLI